jgi:hypothetical protein
VGQAEWGIKRPRLTQERVLQNSFHNQHIPRRRGDAHRLRPDLDREQGFDLQTRAIMRAVVLTRIAQAFWRIGVRHYSGASV